MILPNDGDYQHLWPEFRSILPQLQIRGLCAVQAWEAFEIRYRDTVAMIRRDNSVGLLGTIFTVTYLFEKSGLRAPDPFEIVTYYYDRNYRSDKEVFSNPQIDKITHVRVVAAGGLGDSIAMTGLIESLARYGYVVSLQCDAKQRGVFDDNPHVVETVPNAFVLDLGAGFHYHDMNENFCMQFLRIAEERLGHSLPEVKKPKLHLDGERLFEEPYLLINAGSYRGASQKQWPRAHWQTVIDWLNTNTSFTLVQIGSNSNVNQFTNHQPLDGVISMINQTTMRELMVLTKHANGVICNGITGILHAAQSLNTRCLSLCGASECLTKFSDYDCVQFVSNCDDFECSKCLDRGDCRCLQLRGYAPCMQALSPEQVIGRLPEFLARCEKT